MSKNHKKGCRALNYLSFVSAVSGYVSFFAFASLVCVPVGIASSAAGIQVCATTAGIKKHKSII